MSVRKHKVHNNIILMARVFATHYIILYYKTPYKKKVAPKKTESVYSNLYCWYTYGCLFAKSWFTYTQHQQQQARVRIGTDRAYKTKKCFAGDNRVRTAHPDDHDEGIVKNFKSPMNLSEPL